MRHSVSCLLIVVAWGWIGVSQDVAAQPPAKESPAKASSTPAERPGRGADEPSGFNPRDGRPRISDEEGRNQSLFGGRRGDPRPDAPRFGHPLNPPRNDLHPPGLQPSDPYRGPGGQARLEELKKYDPEMYELETKDIDLEQQSYDLGQQYRRVPREQRDALKLQLQEVVQKHFDARQARRQLQLKRLEEELNRMRSAMERRTESREQIVDRRVVELIGERSDFDF